MDKIYDVAIIGSGPAGMSAAVYAGRANASVVLVESGAPGGKMVKTDWIENYPGYQRVSGTDLSMTMHQHSLAFGADYAYGHVTALTKDKDHFVIKSAESSWMAQHVIVACGTTERLLNLDNEEALYGKGLSYCAVCDGAFYKDQPVVVIGGGNSAVQAALYLANFCQEVTLVMRRDVFRADETNQARLKKNPKIRLLQNVTYQKVVCDSEGHVEGLVVSHKEDGRMETLACKAIFPYIGQIPNTDFLSGLSILDEAGYIKVGPNMETAVSGLYGAGDICVKDLRQIVTATSDGAIAAQDIANRLDS